MIQYRSRFVPRTGSLFLLLALFVGCDKKTNSAEPGNSAGSANGGAAFSSSAGAAGNLDVSAGGNNSQGGNSSGTANNSSIGLVGFQRLPLDLKSAGNYAVLAKSAISTVPTSAIVGNVGLSPAAASYITGFSLIADSTNTFATSSQVTGKLFAANYAVPTPADLTSAVADMLLAFSDAAGRAPDTSELGAGNVGSMILAPGIYKWTTTLTIPADVTLSGSSTSVWIFQIGQDLTLSNGAKVVLSGGALAKNVFWQVSSLVTIGAKSHLEGVVLSETSVALGAGASVNGRLLAQTAINMDSSTIVVPN